MTNHHPGQIGSTSGIERTPAGKRRSAARRAREEARWARKSGPVTVRYVCPICNGPHARADHV